MIKQDIATQVLGYPETSMTKTSTRLVPKSAPFAEYLSNLSGKDFFKLPKEKPPVEPKPIDLDSSDIDWKKTLKVMGIMLTNNPTVLVENQLTHETSVLSIGDQIEGLILKDIQKDKLIFDQQGKSLEIIL